MAIEGFARTLQKLRQERHLSQKQLADAIGLSQRKISFLESGKEVPSPEIIEQLRAYFNLDADTWNNLLEQKRKRSVLAMPADTIGRRIRVMRTYFKQSQSEFAQELNISQSAMSAIEIDTYTPSYEILCKLGRMGFHLNWILYGESDPLPPRAVLDHIVESNERQKINKLLETLPLNKLTAVRKAMELLLRS
ncbi:helix-turn-helix transcriptional regulator [Selenomonas noxia]|uniref:helix-turn-helix transcriptional regulator n=1 Tax=Selenomonas noxia TaxID=135083 RepID=UPI0028D7CE2B|nr:helix-turn-helix transcriptional regulator [Selenomonas noxia]